MASTVIRAALSCIIVEYVHVVTCCGSTWYCH